ncbi:uncharacterized protein BT62DRAFT_83534 [Guyanagaster necrorhizus]|uniref:Uncharacterized protein n=1 Tax=Guyanagaster necrorhizus TaxID=856835 RepID=A0A9P8AT83_9AGAR|nr:uncharacterized protein BT62DRAFT_83534 [Guyanagaster necrorhizus MCA 3950]KAG7446721.1 hypothetical protein BT62DRAFT_83534 [Guyanagaster necrorhizus MCA 3950]
MIFSWEALRLTSRGLLKTMITASFVCLPFLPPDTTLFMALLPFIVFGGSGNWGKQFTISSGPEYRCFLIDIYAFCIRTMLFHTFNRSFTVLFC